MRSARIRFLSQLACRGGLVVAALLFCPAAALGPYRVGTGLATTLSNRQKTEIGKQKIGKTKLITCFLISIFCFLAALPAWSTTVTGTVKRPDGTPVNGTIEFVLSQAAKTITPPQIFVPVKTTCAVTNGLIAAGCTVQGNDTLDPAGTYYRVRVMDNNRVEVMPFTNYTLSGASVDLGSLPLTAQATLVPPTGSVTGNLNVTGNLTVGGAATLNEVTGARKVNNLRYASQFAGADAGAKIAAAITDLPATGGTVVADFEGSQTFGATLTLNKPVRLICNPSATFTLANGVNANMVNITASGVEIDSSCVFDGNRANQTAGVGVSASGASNVTVQGTIRNTFDKAVSATAVTNFRLENYDISNAGQAGNTKAIQVDGGGGSSVGVYIGPGKIDSSASNNGCITIASNTAGNSITWVTIDHPECIVGDAGGTDTLGVEVFGALGTLEHFNVWAKVRGENTTNTNIFGISVGGNAGQVRDGIVGGDVLNAGKICVEIVAAFGVHADGTVTCRDSGRSKLGGGGKAISYTGNTHHGFVDSGNGNQHIEVDNSAGNEDLKINNNQLYCPRLYGIQFIASTGTSGFQANGNLVDGCDSATINMAGIRIEGAANGQVNDNTFRNFSSSGSRGLLITATANGASISYSGNKCEDVASDCVLNQAVTENPQWQEPVKSHVKFTDGGTTPTLSTGQYLIFQNNDTSTDRVRLGLFGGTSGFSAIEFGDSATAAKGKLQYDIANNTLRMATNAVDRWDFDASGHFKAVTDNTLDIGQSGANRPRNLYLAGSLTVGSGVAANGGGFKHTRVSTGSIGAGASAAVTLTWTTAFADANYTPVCQIQEATAGTASLRLHHIESIAAGSIVVRVVNDDGATAKTGTLLCQAVHD